ncbi:hypothetical protein [Caballeronia sp. Lep1P3]|uniref:hypothetical protein n=1 Tax=Caballeronia sp. Lep1P3 TaxID=2878150 RepID=UPI001FD5D912|nr:hypothetical protein [Caballeronia sp. Lep1P3]
METTIARVFQTMEEAEKARDALVSAGVQPEAVDIAFQADEAGPVRGNFLAGDSKTSIGHQEEYDARFRHQGEVSRFILTVRLDEARASEAEAALQRAGGQTIDDVTAASRGNGPARA